VEQSSTRCEYLSSFLLAFHFLRKVLCASLHPLFERLQSEGMFFLDVRTVVVHDEEVSEYNERYRTVRDIDTQRHIEMANAETPTEEFDTESRVHA
jgi:hypothetical protein